MDVEIPLAVAMIMDINGFLSGNTTAIKMAVLALTAAIIIMPDKSRAVRAIYSRILRIRWARRIPTLPITSMRFHGRCIF